MNLFDLRDELDNDPEGRGYAGMNDQQAADDLNLLRKSKNLATMTGRQAKALVDTDEYTALPDAKKQQWIGLTSSDDLDPWGFDAQVAIDVFGNPSNTLTALQAARTVAISRGHELNLVSQGEDVTRTDVENARKI